MKKFDRLPEDLRTVLLNALNASHALAYGDGTLEAVDEADTALEEMILRYIGNVALNKGKDFRHPL